MSLYKGQKEKSEILSLYQEKLDCLGLDYQMRKVETDFGLTNIVICGDQGKTPLVLLHGSNGNSAIVVEPFKQLLNTHCLIAIDVIGQPNYSSEKRPNMKTNSYAIWLDQVLTKLKLNSVIVYGMSFGGFILLNALIHRPSKIKEAILHVPAGLVNGNPLVAIFKVFLPMKNYMKTKNPKKLDTFLNTLFTQPDNFAYSFLSKVLQNFEMDFTPIPIYSNRGLKQIKTPTHVIAAKEDCFFPGRKLVKRMKKRISTLEKILVQENAKHVPNEIQNIEICNFIKSIL